LNCVDNWSMPGRSFPRWALASEPAQTSLWDEASPIPHTRLGQNADLILVAPATARQISAYATGYSFDLLTATLLATRAPVIMCPAMHTEMWEHPSTQENLATLRRRGVIIVDPEEGRLAGGDVGAGRLAAPERILDVVRTTLGPRDLDGLSVVVSAGGTREAVDPVRFLGNRSSGKQGIAVAVAASQRGASVTLVSTVAAAVPESVKVVRVESAAQMHDAVMDAAEGADIVVMAAAVADFRPVEVADNKLKKRDGVPQIVLEPTVDILAALGAAKPANQTLVGFAAETTDVAENATAKLRQKNADLLVANDVSAPGVGFEHETNAVTIFTSGGRLDIGLRSKGEIAHAILDAVISHRQD
jgi:phosphopantothenoylcysteine decarboxylase/phosphopantothenate--cysteine ligase